METMRALRLSGPDPRTAEIAEVPVPSPAIGDVLVRVHAASFTPTELDWPSTFADRTGADRAPAIPCHEVCGEVVGFGYGTFGFDLGDRVYGLTDWYRDGAAAEYVAVEARNLAPSPIRCRAVEAAAVPLAALSAWQSLFDRGGLASGQTALVTGATGGVGVFALQLAHAAGAKVVAAGRPDREPVARDLGADAFFDLEHPRWDDLAGTVDVALDLLGGDTLDQLLKHSVAKTVVSLVEMREGVEFFVVEPHRPTLTELARRVDAGDVRPVLGDVIPFADATRAFSEAQHGPGKRVIDVAGS